ncbi:MAG TPA: hypothetical protein DHV29_01815 [Bacteroidales bacterium]|nr:hypothetical protein [Bacteroidales bacterium]HCY22205.1 hypothetical protein [Bacteroidales bacterium]
MMGEITMQLAWSEFIWSDKIWIIIGAVFMILGLVGCFVKIIPGTPFGLAGLMMLQLMKEPPFYTFQILILSAITIVVISVDYVAPAIAEKQFGKTRPGIIISNIVKFAVVGYMAYLFVRAIIQVHA